MILSIDRNSPIGHASDTPESRRAASISFGLKCPVTVSNRNATIKGTLGIGLLLALLCGSSLMAANPEQKLIRVTTKKDHSVTEFFVENLQDASVTVTFEVETKNMNSTEVLPCTKTYAPGSLTKVFSLSPGDTDEDSSWSYTYFATWGRLDAVHDDSYLYSLPYAAGQTFSVSQGFNGEFSHFGSDQYAIDWKMPLGTAVHAARDGVVVGIKDDSDRGGGDKKFEWDANYILVQHSDGTMGHYVHLQKGGCQVKIGQTVSVGQWIGVSGNTGHSTGAHLHFAVFKAKDGKHRQTVPIQYRTATENAVTLQEGNKYTAVRPSAQASVRLQAGPALGILDHRSAASP